MKKQFILLTFLLVSILINAQKDPNIYDFFGGKSYHNETVFFRLLFEIENGKVSGYIFTDEQGSNAEKSIIEGTYNKKTKRIVFKETQKLITKTRHRFNELCYLNGIFLLDINTKISSIKGGFIEQNAVDQKCKTGKISLISTDPFITLKKKIEADEKETVVSKITKTATIKKATKNTATVKPTIIKTRKAKVKKEKLVKTPTKKVVMPSFKSNKKIIIKDGEEITVYWNTNTFTIELWDEEVEDGDKLTIEFNDKIILENFELKNKKESIKLPLTKGDNKIIITANNVGKFGLNTARVTIFDDEIRHEIVTKLDLNKSVIVNIQRNKK